ncbi:unnamed protein product [Lampetra fluviatilis]
MSPRKGAREGGKEGPPAPPTPNERPRSIDVPNRCHRIDGPMCRARRTTLKNNSRSLRCILECLCSCCRYCLLLLPMLLLLPHAATGAACYCCWCRCRMLLLLLPHAPAAATACYCCRVLLLLHAATGAASYCCWCRMLLLLLLLAHAAAATFRCRVLLLPLPRAAAAAACCCCMNLWNHRVYDKRSSVEFGQRSHYSTAELGKLFSPLPASSVLPPCASVRLPRACTASAAS